MYQISSHLVHKQGHYGNILNFWHIWKKVWGRVINPLWCLKAPGPATKKWIFEFYTKFGFRNHLQTFWPRRLVKSELSLGLNGNDALTPNFIIKFNLIFQISNKWYSLGTRSDMYLSLLFLSYAWAVGFNNNSPQASKYLDLLHKAIKFLYFTQSLC